MKKVSANITKYTDSIALYAGYRTPFVAGGLSNFINTDKNEHQAGQQRETRHQKRQE